MSPTPWDGAYPSSHFVPWCLHEQVLGGIPLAAGNGDLASGFEITTFQDRYCCYLSCYGIAIAVMASMSMILRFDYAFRFHELGEFGGPGCLELGLSFGLPDMFGRLLLDPGSAS